MAWKQPAPTKAWAIYYKGAWYGQAETAREAWLAAYRQVGAGYSREGNIMRLKLQDYGRAVRTAPTAAA